MPRQAGYITFQPQGNHYDKKSRSTFDSLAIPLGQAFDEGKEERRIKTQIDARTDAFVKHLQTANREMLSVIASAQEVINRNSQIMERVERKLESIK